MPRKQRFKPSRKPKPDVQNRGATSEQQPSQIGISHETDGVRDVSHTAGDDSSVEPDLGRRSR
jgi:hypothetical protein